MAYQQPRYTPFTPASGPDYAMQGNPLTPKSGLIGGLIKSYLGGVTGGIIGGGGDEQKSTPATSGAPAQTGFMGAAQQAPSQMFDQFQQQNPMVGGAMQGIGNAMGLSGAPQNPNQQAGVDGGMLNQPQQQQMPWTQQFSNFFQ